MDVSDAIDHLGVGHPVGSHLSPPDAEVNPDQVFAAEPFPGDPSSAGPEGASSSGEPSLHCVVFAADFVTEHHDVTMPIASGVEHALQAVSACSIRLQELAPASLIPTTPQLGSGYASFLLIPKWLGASFRRIVIMDFSALNGPVYARFVHDRITYRDLELEANLHTTRLWEAFVYKDFRPISRGSSSLVCSGDVIRFAPSQDGPQWGHSIDFLLSQPDLWAAFPTDISAEQDVGSCLVLRQDSAVAFPYRCISEEHLHLAIARAMYREVHNVSFGFPLPHEGLQDVVHNGYRTPIIIGADPRSEDIPPGPNLGCFVFLDCRSTGRGISFLFETPRLMQTNKAVQYLGLWPPTGYRPYAEHHSLEPSGVQVEAGTVICFGFEPEDIDYSFAGDMPQADQAGHQRRSIVDHHELFMLSAADVSPRTADAVMRPMEITHLSSAPAIVGCVVLLPRQAPEYHDIQISTPCSPQQACNVLVEARRSQLLCVYEHIIVAAPQPSDAFCTFIAVPEWAHSLVFIAVDARQIDGRLFCAQMEDGLFLRSIRAQLGLHPRHGPKIYHRGAVLDDTSPVRLSKGDTLSLIPWDGVDPISTTLTQMLGRANRWTVPCPRMVTPLQNMVYVLTDAWNTAVAVPVSCLETVGRLHSFVAAYLRADPDRLHIQRPSPHIDNYDASGRGCSKVLVATEAVPDVVMPPARPFCNQTIYILDTRPILGDLRWRVVVGDEVDAEALMREFPSPNGYYTSIEGGVPVRSDDRTYLQIRPGQVITIEYCSDLLGDGSDISAAHPSTPNSAGSDEGNSDSDSPSSPRPPPGPARRGTPPATGQDPETLHDESTGFISALVRVWPQRTCKILYEPICHSSADSSMLADLRRITVRMGHPWPYLPADGGPHTDDDILSGSDDDEALATPVWACFTVLVPGYAPDTRMITLTMPATLQEATDALQAARQTQFAEDFPYLVDVSPQPIDGHGVFIGCPNWQGVSMIVCFDLIGYDGRIFAEHVPAYCSRQQLLHYARVDRWSADDPDVAVFLGFFEEPLEDGVEVHLFPGENVRILHSGRLPGQNSSLTQLLLSPMAWSTTPPFPEVSPDGLYCLVDDSGGRLVSVDINEPFRYRATVAAAAGIPEVQVRVFPANPRVPNAASAGMICRTCIVAVSELDMHARGSEHAVILDSRIFLAGWRTVWPQADSIDSRDLIDDLRSLCPPGWLPALDIALGEQGIAHTAPGAVISVRAYRDVPPRIGPFHISPAPAVFNAGYAILGDHRPLAALPQGSTVYMIQFLVYSPDRLVEFVEVEARRGTPIRPLLARVNSCRPGQLRQLSPGLLAADPQPDPSYCAVLAVPQWQPPGVFVLVDCRHYDDRAFAALVPVSISRGSLLAIVDIDPHEHVLIFVGHADRPIEAGQEIFPQHGTTIQITRPASVVPHRLHVQAMLDANTAWPEAPLPPGFFDDRTYILTPQEHFSLRGHPASGDFRHRLAELCAIEEPDILLLDSTPQIRDFSALGRASRSVMLATRHGTVRQPATEDVLVVLDRRPIYLGLSVWRAPSGRIRGDDVAGRFSGLCPEGFVPRILDGASGEVLPEQDQAVSLGHVFIVTFQPLIEAGAQTLPLPGNAHLPSLHQPAPVPVTPSRGCQAGQAKQPSGGNRWTATLLLAVGISMAIPTSRVGALAPCICSRQSACFHSHCITPRAAASLGPGLSELRPLGSIGYTSSRVVMCLPTFDSLVHTSVLLGVAFLILQVPLQGYQRVLVGSFLWLCVFPTRAAGVQHRSFEPRVYERAQSDMSVRCDVNGILSASRPIPTPLRRGNGPRCFEIPVDVSIPARTESIPSEYDRALFTLLEESIQATDSTAFFLAATLLETLFEHFGAVNNEDPGRPADALADPRGATGGPAVRISLSDALATSLHDDCYPATGLGIPSHVPCINLDSGQCRLPITKSMWQDVLHRVPIACLDVTVDSLTGSHRFLHWHGEGFPGCFPADAHTICFTADGSFCPASGQGGWGVVVSVTTGDSPGLPGLFVGAFGGSTDEEWSLAADVTTPLDAYTAETIGLMWAGIAAFQLGFCGPHVFRCDNEAALGAAAGQCRSGDLSIWRACRGIHFGFRIWAASAPDYVHVKGHEGDPANELADALAEQGRQRQGYNPFSLVLPHWFRDDGHPFQWLPHLAWMHRRHMQAPSLYEDVMSWGDTIPGLTIPTEQVIRPFLRSAPEATQAAGAPHRRRCLFVTYNALSLAQPGTGADDGQAGLHGSTGRVTLLDETLFARNAFIVGVQEARTPQGTYCAQHFRRYASGSLEGKHYGIEVWIRSDPDWPSHEVAILSATPTYLALQACFGSFRLGVFAGHGPHRGRPADQRTAWWQDISRLCSSLPVGIPWVFLVDVNGRLGSIADDAIGEHEADEEDIAGQAFRLLIGRHQAWSPSTFSAFARGPGGTLYQKRSKTLDRSDFVAIPSEWREATICAEVLADIHAGHSAPDHFAAGDLDFQRPHHSMPRKIDPRALVDPVNAPRIRAILADTPKVPWQANVNEHASIVVDHVYEKLVSAFPLQGRPMRQHFLQQATVQLHEHLKMLRQSLRRCVYNLSSARLRCAWLAWRSATPWRQLFQGRWLTEVRFAIAWLSYHIGLAGKAVRKGCRQDRNNFLAHLQVDQASASEVHSAIKRLIRPRRFRKQGPTPLPRLRNPEGVLCTSPAEIQKTWRDHFARLEGGTQCTPEDLVIDCVRRQQRRGPQEHLLCQELPAFDDLVEALRRAQPFKACGSDLIPPALCHGHAVDVAGLLWPILVKVLTQGSEPIGFKGGRLFHIPKPNATDKASTDAHRGILVQPVFGKALHRATRALSVEFMERHAPALQLGSRQGKTHAFGFLMSRSFLAYGRTNNLSVALLFLDLQAAYYAVVRELILGSDLSDASLSEVVRSLALAPGVDVDSIASYAGTDPVLSPSNSANVAGLTFDAVSSHGLTPNIGPKKSAAILVPRGAGSKRARDNIFGQGGGKLHVLREGTGAVKLDAVSQYRHLGSTITHNGSMMSEVRNRLALARAAFGEARKKIFVCPHIAIHRRVQLFRAHILSALIAGAGAWPCLPQEAWTTFQQGLTALLRQLIRIPHDASQRWTRDDVYAACGISSPQELLHAERLRFLGQMILHAPDATWALLQHHDAALEAFHAACDWLFIAVSATSGLGPHRDDWQNWTELVKRRPKQWKGLIKRAVSWYSNRRTAQVLVDNFARATWERVAPIAVAAPLSEHACLMCRRAFPNAHTWSSHAALQHGYRTKARRLARGRLSNEETPISFQCAICLMVIPRVGQQPALREGVFSEDTQILEVVQTFVEPFSLLKDTLVFWRDELDAGPVRDRADDVLLCFQVDLLCDERHARPSPDPEAGRFEPCILPLLRSPRPAGLAGLVAGQCLDFDLSWLGLSPGGGWRYLPLSLLPPHNVEWACVVLTLPPAPCSSAQVPVVTDRCDPMRRMAPGRDGILIE
ncbi:unnamed protein product [Symbiodinium sp. CCMP2592]|nr:unnamed protein product [Symbiodinium sp. CCMP2592]